MADPSRHGRHARGRHPAHSVSAHDVEPTHRRPGRRRRHAAPIAAFLAVLVVAVGGAWALRDGGPGREAGLLAETRGGTSATAGPVPEQTGADRASRGKRAAPVPALGTVAPGATTTMPAPSTMPGPTATAAPGRGTPVRPPSTRPTTAPAPRPTAASAPADPGVVAEVTRLTNVERAKAGCGAVRVDARLAAAAQAHSKDMVDRDYFSHTSPDGKGPGDRAAAAGYRRWSGENIAAGYPTPAAVVLGWMNSAGHKANILNCQSKASGVGYDDRRNMWTQMFGFE